MLNRLSRSYHEQGFKTEILAGITTFLTMVYIVFVNPAILSKGGMDYGAVFTATCLVSAIGCLCAGLLANAPIGIAPGMALNIFFTYTVILHAGFRWQQALAMVFISGLMFLIVMLTPLKRLLLDAIPKNLPIAMLIGIGFLIALIALKTNQMIIANEHTLMQLGDITSASNLLFFAGFILILVLDYWRIPGHIMIGILTISLIGYCCGMTRFTGIINLPPSLSPSLLQLDFSGLNTASGLKAIFTFFLIAMFDATGTLIGLFSQPLFKNRMTHDRMLNQTLTVDALTSTIAGILGTGSTSPYIESQAGIIAGGRQGMTAITVGIGFLLMLFFFPLAQMIPGYAVGAALLYIACCIFQHAAMLDLSDRQEAAACLVTILMMPLTGSIADGIGAGIIVFSVLKVLTRQSINPLLLILCLVFILFFYLG